MLLALLLLLLAAGGPLCAQPPSPAAVAAGGPPPLQARSAILVEARTGAVLFQHRADEAVPPASLTKLMTLHIALERIRSGRLRRTEIIVPEPEAWARTCPSAPP